MAWIRPLTESGGQGGETRRRSHRSQHAFVAGRQMILSVVDLDAAGRIVAVTEGSGRRPILILWNSRLPSPALIMG